MEVAGNKTSTDRMKRWGKHWNEDDIEWHDPNVHRYLKKHASLLFEARETKTFFIPLCGKSVDMKWLSDKGQFVVGVDGVRKSLEDFCNEQGLEWTEGDAPGMGPGCHVLKVKERKLRLYNSDVFLFNTLVEGQFDCIWDRGALDTVERNDLKAYVALLKKLLKPGGKMMVEVYEYDGTTFSDRPEYPPPFPMFEDEMRSLFEKDCTLEMIDRGKRHIGGYDLDIVFYFIVKTDVPT